MKRKFTTGLTLLVILFTNHLHARDLTGREAQQFMNGAERIITGTHSQIPEYIQFSRESQVPFMQFDSWMHQNMSSQYGFSLLNATPDHIGMVHYRYQQTFNKYPIEGSMVIVHARNDRIVSINGLSFNKINASATVSLAEADALNKALGYMNAVTYMWQVPQMEEQLKRESNNAGATAFPKGELMFASYKGSLDETSYRLAYRFDIYAAQPFRREYIYVDANTGEIVNTTNRICSATNSTGAAVTAYSGNRNILTDSTSATSYRLRESGRGQGIETYNLKTGTNYANAVDFVNTTNNWNQVNANHDQYATDAHWGAEMCYDFYMTKYNRNSIDNSGYKLLNYVHYSSNLLNAYWDGQRMSYGDGDASHTPLTSLDIIGHEITHGLTAHTSGLPGNGSGEGGAMNEGMSDCFGIAIRQFGKQSASTDWVLGDEIGGAPFRDLANPKNTKNPDTYKGVNWDAAQEVHTNSTIISHAFYLVAIGGGGTNDNGSAYNVTGVGLDKADDIWYRLETVYLTPSSVYADARTYAIIAAQDLFGGCSPEAEATTNAWYAVGIGNAYNPVVTSSFTADDTSFCALPAAVQFTNTSNIGNTYRWNFGDGSTSTARNPSHTYTTSGTFPVFLFTDGGTCGKDSVTKAGYIVINLPPGPTAASVNACAGKSATLNATGSSIISWYDSTMGGTLLDTGSVMITPSLSATTTYYVESDIFLPSQQTGLPDNSTGFGSYIPTTTYGGLTFDTYKSLKLISVNVYAQAAGSESFTLMQNGVTLDSMNTNLTTGLNTIMLNWNIPSGTGFELGCQGNVSLFYQLTGATFPYTLPGMLSLTGPITNFYYYFYKWAVQLPPCISARTPVTVTVSACSGVSEVADENGISVYPNPVNNELTITFDPSYPGNKLLMKLTDITGNLIAERTVPVVEYHWDLSGLAAGCYILTMQNEKGERVVKKIVRE